MVKINTTFYHTNQLLYCKGHIEITSIPTITNMEKNRVNMIKLWIEIHLEFILHSITLTN